MKIHGFNPSEQEMTVMIKNVDKGRGQNTKKILPDQFTLCRGVSPLAFFLFRTFP